MISIDDLEKMVEERIHWLQEESEQLRRNYHYERGKLEGFKIGVRDFAGRVAASLDNNQPGVGEECEKEKD